MRPAGRRARIVVALAFAAASFAVIAPAASASGTSPKTNGCYAKWWHTAFAGYCNPARVTGYYRIMADCKAPQIPDVRGPWIHIRKGWDPKPFDSRACAYGIHYARVEFKG
jgi:hypothetical protein